MNQFGLGLNLSTRRTRKREFLDEMERVVPWAALVQVVEPHDPRARTRVINDILRSKGPMMNKGTVVDATLIAAPRSTRNAEGERDPEMKQADNGNQRCSGMKAHIGVDAHAGLVHRC